MGKLLKTIADYIDPNRIKLPPVTGSFGTGMCSIIEGAIIWNYSRDAFDAIKKLYDTTSESTKHYMAFSPKRENVVERAYWWRLLVHEALPGKEAAMGMQAILRHYRLVCIPIHDKRQAEEAAREKELREAHERHEREYLARCKYEARREVTA